MEAGIITNAATGVKTKQKLGEGQQYDWDWD